VTGRLRVALLVAGVAALELAASPAFASTSEDGGDAGLTVVQTLLLYVATPLVAFAIIALLVLGPSMARAGSTKRDGAHGPVLGEPPHEPAPNPKHH
jgi:hypothetical protein